MFVKTPGKVTEKIWLVGSRESCAYLVDGGGEYALLGGAMAYVVPDLLEQLQAFGIDEGKIRRIMILHSHFDHCGMVPFLARRWPRARVTASKRAQALLQAPKVVDNIEALNRAAIEQKGLAAEADRLNLAFTPVAVEDVVKDGQVLPCGGPEPGNPRSARPFVLFHRRLPARRKGPFRLRCRRYTVW